MFEAPGLNLINPDSEYDSASSYSSPNFSSNSSPNPASSSSGLMYASMGLSAISAITSAFSQSAALKARGDYEATIANTNSKIAAFQAKQEIEAGGVEANRKNLQTEGQVGEVRARQGASGVDVASGSNTLVRTAIQNAGAQDELTIRNNAARRAWGYETEAIQDTYKGQFAKLTAKAQSEQTLLNGGLSAISGSLAIESNYLRFARYMSGGGGGEANVPFPERSKN